MARSLWESASHLATETLHADPHPSCCHCAGRVPAVPGSVHAPPTCAHCHGRACPCHHYLSPCPCPCAHGSACPYLCPCPCAEHTCADTDPCAAPCAGTRPCPCLCASGAHG